MIWAIGQQIKLASVKGYYYFTTDFVPSLNRYCHTLSDRDKMTLAITEINNTRNLFDDSVIQQLKDVTQDDIEWLSFFNMSVLDIFIDDICL